MNVVRFARRRGKMEMINGEKKLHVWLYKYEQDGVSPVFEVDGSRQEGSVPKFV